MFIFWYIDILYIRLSLNVISYNHSGCVPVELNDLLQIIESGWVSKL